MAGSRYSVIEQGGVWTVYDEQTGDSVGQSGDEAGARQLANDLESREGWQTDIVGTQEEEQPVTPPDNGQGAADAPTPDAPEGKTKK